jgi:hypothetical protein
MADSLKDIVLTFPDRLSHEDRVRLLDAYKQEHPQIYEDGVWKETNPTDDPRDVLKDIQLHGIEFLRSKCSYSDLTDVIRAWAQMRSELLDQLWKARSPAAKQ